MPGTLIVAGDVGGTNARLQLWRVEAAAAAAAGSAPRAATLVASDTSSSQSHASPCALLDAFFALAAVDAKDIGCCSLALCGPVDARANVCAILDALPHWGRVAGNELDAHFGWPTGTCLLANDFVAVAEGVIALQQQPDADDDDGGLRKLGGGDGREGEPMVCIGAGTGLGVSYLLADPVSGEYKAHPCEMGMAAFGPRTMDERLVVDALDSDREHVVIEDIVSGQGVWRAHKAFSGSDVDTAALVARLAGDDAVARRAVDLVVAGLGRAMADCLHIFLATNGIYIAGGVLAKVLDVYPQAADVLLNAFRAAVSLKHLVPLTPVVLVTVESGLLGAKRLAMQQLGRSPPQHTPLAVPSPSSMSAPVAATTLADTSDGTSDAALAVPRRLGPPYDLEYSLHAAPRAFRRELPLVFAERGEAIGKDESLHVLLLMQHAKHDLLGMTPDVAAEKDRLLEQHMRLADPLCRILRGRGFWADYTDPASGQPVLAAAGPSIYPDLSGFVRMLKYPTFDAGGCRVCTHPQWGTNCYPSTVFFSAPPALADAIFQMITGAQR